MKLRKSTNGLSLLKRRVWYADPPADDSADDDAPETTPKPEPRKGDLSTASTEDLLAEIKELRRENANRRKTASELEKWKADKEAAEKKASESTLLEEKKYQELLTKREKELADIQAELGRERLNNLRMKIGVELKLPAPIISRLQGDTEDALREDAKALLEALPQLNQQPQPEAQPQTNPARRQTTTTVPDGQPPQDTPEARIKARREKVPPIFQAGNVRFVNKSEE